MNGQSSNTSVNVIKNLQTCELHEKIIETKEKRTRLPHSIQQSITQRDSKVRNTSEGFDGTISNFPTFSSESLQGLPLKGFFNSTAWGGKEGKESTRRMKVKPPLGKSPKGSMYPILENKQGVKNKEG